MAGYFKTPGGKYFRNANGKLIRVGTYAPPPAERVMMPNAATIKSSVLPGTQISALVFTGFPASEISLFTHEFTNEFSGVSYVATLTNDAGGRVALSGNWEQGYKLVVGSATLTAGVYAIQIQVSGFPETFQISLTVESVATEEGETLFSAKVENYDTVTSWADQEISTAQWFAPGDVPPGRIAVLSVDGVRVPQQVSNRTTWMDGSLKLAQVRFLMPSMAAGTSKDIVWEAVDGTWTANDAPLHTATTAITSKVSLNYSFTSYKGRSLTDVLTEERGPKNFKSSDMLGTANAPWIERIVSGPVCTEWRASDMATNAAGARSPTENLGCLLYARAWGGTANNPKRIQFFYRSVYGWSTDVAADEQGLRVDLNLSVNNTVIRGAAIGTANWGSVNTWKGGFVVSAGTDGKMDWFDVASNSYVVPPKLIYRHNISYGVQSKLVPPYDTSNSSFPMTAAADIYRPGRRGPLRPEQGDVADHATLWWTTSKFPAWCIAAHARGTAAQLAEHQRLARVCGLGMGAMTGVGLHRETRKIICYLPPSKSTNQAALGTSVYGKATNAERRPANTYSGQAAIRKPNGGTVAEIDGLDAAHFPQMSHWPYLSEGDQHWLDLVYQEATLPALFDSDAYGFYGTSTRAKIPFGGILFKGQIRAVAHTVKPITYAMGYGNPSDPHWVMCRDMFDHWAEMNEEIVLEEDAWRGGLNRTDGRRFQDLKVIWPNNEPSYKFWMHSFGLHGLSYAYGITEYPRIKERAEWWSHALVVMSGGYKNDVGDQYYLMKPDPLGVANYNILSMSSGSGATTEDRRYWTFGQWKANTSVCTFKADNQTLSFTGPMQGTTAMMDGMVITITGIRGTGEPFEVTDMTKIPGLLTRNIPYYAVQSSGNTCKISLSLGGSPVTFNTNGVDIVGAVVRTAVNGVHPVSGSEFVSVDPNNYLIQVYAALSMYQHYVAPSDPRVLLARQSLFNLKNTSSAPNAWDERGKVTVPLSIQQITSNFSSDFSNEFA